MSGFCLKPTSQVISQQCSQWIIWRLIIVSIYIGTFLLVHEICLVKPFRETGRPVDNAGYPESGALVLEVDTKK